MSRMNTISNRTKSIIFFGDLNISQKLLEISFNFFLFIRCGSEGNRQEKGKFDQFMCFRSVKYAWKEVSLISIQLNMHQINFQAIKQPLQIVCNVYSRSRTAYRRVD